MSWDNITGDSKILPSSSAGGADEIKLESGTPKKVRIILGEGEEPYSYLEHAIEVERIENGKTVKDFRTVRCPKTSSNPNAYCPICDGQQYRRRVRNAANAWDYDLGKVQKLNQGEGVWKPIATTRKLGINILGVDWALLKSGTTRNDTEYSATNLGPTDFALPADAQLFDIKSEYAPHTVEEMKAIIESVGIDWNTAITPPALQYPSLQDALDHVMPNGKYKDQSFRNIWENDKSPKGMINYLATKSDRITAEKACAQVILVNLGGANIEGVPRFNGATPASTPATTATTAPSASTPVTTINAPASASTTVSPDRTNKINQINQILSSDKKFIDGGFALIMDTMKKASNGKTNIAEFTDAELDGLLADISAK